MRDRVVHGATLATAALAVAASGVEAQSAAEIVDRMLSEYERRAEGVEDYTLVQDAMGIETVSYFVKETMDGRPVFRLRANSAGVTDFSDSGQGGVDEVYAWGEELARRAEYEGRRRVDDYELHVLSIDDFSGFDAWNDVSPDAEFVARRGSLFLDVDTYAPRQLVFEGDMTNAEGTHPVTTTVRLGDYREVGGMLVAYRTLVTIEGLGAAIDAETRAQFQEMQRELDGLPPEQRAMVESMMASQLEQFRAMLEGDGAPLTVEILVREVRVNAGPPG